MKIRTPGIKPAEPARPDFELIADTGSLEAYKNAWNAFPSERDTLEMLFPDLDDAMFASHVEHFQGR